MDARRRVFVGLYALSGAAALVYEVVWTRLLTLQMGQTVAAAGTVLAAFMGGLALGAWLAGRTGGGLRAYASLEILVAAIAIALPALSATLSPALVWAYADGASPARFALVRLVLSLVLLGTPAAAMGATFPISAAWFARGADRQAAEAGRLYAANTAGAAVGALAAGFWFVPALGLRGTTWTGVALNAVAALGAVALSLGDAPEEDAVRPAPGRGAARAKAAPEFRPGRPALACAAVAASGSIALVYEVAWTRLLALILGPTTFAFATMAASFITGLAIGSAAGSRAARRSTRPGVLVAALLAVTAVAASLAGWFASSRLPLLVGARVASPDAAFGAIIVWQGAVVALVLLPMTCALGATFPLALALASAGPAAVRRDAAAVYAANTAGAILGALAGAFVLLPWLGLEATFRATAFTGLLASAGVWLATLQPGRAVRRVTAGALAFALAGGLVAAMPAWDRELLASGAYKYAPYVGGEDLGTALRAGRLVYYKDGASATVSVRRLAATLSLAIDGKVDASNGGDMLTQRLLGLLPVLLHPHPANICIIGLGSGVTVGSALAPGVIRHADVVEISPEVVEASAFFAKENGGALAAPEVHLIVGDGRTHLLLTRARYDVIVSEPSNPWMAGVAALFTREFFEAARARLKPGGLLCQWAHTYDISAGDLRSIVHTFASVFPQGTMWLVGEGDLLLVGGTDPAIESRLALVGQRWRLGRTPSALEDVAIAGDRAPFALLSLFAGGPAALARFGADAPIQTDDRLALEFSAPRGIYGRTANENVAAIQALGAALPAAVRAALASGDAAAWTERGAMELKAEAFGLAFDAFTRAIALDASNEAALAGLSDSAAGSRRQDEARRMLQAIAAAQPANAPVRVELSRLLAAGGDVNGAVDAAEQAMQIAPGDPRPAEQLASVFADAGDVGRLAPLADAILARFPNREKARYYRAAALFLGGATAQAIAEARALVARNPNFARAQNLLGAACATDAQTACARAAFDAALQANPRDPMTYVNLGFLDLQSADASSAIDYFAEALSLDPSLARAREGLSQARAVLASRP